MDNKIQASNINQAKWSKKDIFYSVILIMLGQIICAVLSDKIVEELIPVIQIIAVVIAISYLHHKLHWVVFDRLDTKLFLKYSTIGIICCIIIYYPVSMWLGKTFLQPKSYLVFKKYGLYGEIYLLILLAVMVPILEEILFRAYIYNMLKHKYNIYKAAIITSVLFMLLHAQINIIYLFVPSLIYIYVFEKSKTIWSCILTHSVNNLLWFVMTYWYK